ncbi:MAG: MOSC domain-containing protein [Bryobacteraceae bacterium]|nr:MOSC domain-containing protein [Bryobacteraceae bacterium]
MTTEIGRVEGLFRYPVKSMAGERLEVARIGWHGVEGDRRLALRRVDDRSGMPWLTAGRLPHLLLYAPHGGSGAEEGGLPTHVRTPDGQELAIFGEELAAEVSARFGAPVQMMHLRQGIFDEASISVITSATVGEIGRLSGRSLEPLQFRPNVLIHLLQPAAFEEDKWLGGLLSFGDGDDTPEVAVTLRDIRCGMVTLDPGTARPAPEVMKAIVRANENNAGIYGVVTRTGRIAVGERVFLRAGAASAAGG